MNVQRPSLVMLDRRAELIREEDRHARQGYALGFLLGFFMWVAVVIFCWVVVKVAGPPPVPTDPHYSERPEPDALKRGRTPAP